MKHGIFIVFMYNAISDIASSEFNYKYDALFIYLERWYFEGVNEYWIRNYMNIRSVLNSIADLLTKTHQFVRK